MDKFDNTMQMWVDSYNSYHLLDGLSVKEFYGSVKPGKLLTSDNMQYILKQVCIKVVDTITPYVILHKLSRVVFQKPLLFLTS